MAWCTAKHRPSHRLTPWPVSTCWPGAPKRGCSEVSGFKLGSVQEAGEEGHSWVICDRRSSRKTPVPSPALGKSHRPEWYHECPVYTAPLSLHRQDPFHPHLTPTLRVGATVTPRAQGRNGLRWLGCMLTQPGRWWDWTQGTWTLGEPGRESLTCSGWGDPARGLRVLCCFLCRRARCLASL